jgi:sporulation protein YlmC with PRC-barrel domain
MNIITSDDILGKDVVDIDGGIIGIVQQLRIDKNTKNIIGILVDQGFMKPDLYISLDIVQNFGIDSVFLNRTPNPKIKGLNIYDKAGNLMGYVHSVEEKNDKIISITMKKNQLGKSYLIKSKDIKTIGYNVILKYKSKNFHPKEIKDSGFVNEIMNN